MNGFWNNLTYRKHFKQNKNLLLNEKQCDTLLKEIIRGTTSTHR